MPFSVVRQPKIELPTPKPFPESNRDGAGSARKIRGIGYFDETFAVLTPIAARRNCREVPGWSGPASAHPTGQRRFRHRSVEGEDSFGSDAYLERPVASRSQHLSGKREYACIVIDN